ncbi:hypothetical protein Rhein_0643 [Rheinheimera sp. A13L]|uniref:hypothetical protein n=1 Tax=Rheinheimera sp. A13L TaxID=506534 RepID=UPI000212509E|nr:hypothetical protein [Rheinheimera sp. A13L]EGM79255.1 hypothetical protein Rhein_0643 [Rheinheimera sp. A13L]
MQEISMEMLSHVQCAGANSKSSSASGNKSGTNYNSDGTGYNDEYLVKGQTLSPLAQATVTGLGAAAGLIHPALGVAGAAGSQYFLATIAQDRYMSPAPVYNQSDITNIINSGLTSGGPY